MATVTRQSKIVWTSEASKVIGDFKRIQAEEAKTEAGMRRIAAAADEATRKQRASANAAVGSTGRTSYRDPSLAITRSGRLLARSGADGDYAQASKELTQHRVLRASELKGLRAARVNAQADAARAVKYNAAADMAGYNIGARGFANFDDDKTTARARRMVNQRLAKTPELAGKVTDDDMNNMVGRQTQQLQRRAEIRQNVAQGALAVEGAVVAVAAAADRKLTQYADKIVSTEDTLAGLYGVGQNPLARKQIRQSAIAGSIGGGISLDEMGDLRGRMASAFGDMPAAVSAEAESAAIKFGKLGVKDKTSTALGLGALHGTFGDQLGGGAGAMRLLSNRLALSADVGAFDPDQVTPYLASMGQAFKGSGYKDTDMFAATSLASKSGMRAEAFTTGVRNLPLLMMEGQKKGFKQTGNFAEDMGQLSKMDSPELLDLVGRDVFVVAKMFADNNAQLKEYIAAQEALTAKTDTLGTKIAQSMTDSAFVAAETIKSARQVVENAPAIQADMPWLQEAVTDQEIRKAGAAATSNPLTSWFDTPATWIEGAGAAMMSSSRQAREGKGDLYKAGITQMISGARQSGDNVKADYLTLSGGADTGSYIGGPNGQKSYTGKAEADDWIQMRTKGGYDDLSGNEYTQYRQMQAAGNNDEAQKYLEQVGKSAATAAAALETAAKNLGDKTRDRTAHD